MEKNSVLPIGLLEKMLDVIQRASPAAHAVDVPIRVCQQKVSEVTSHHARDAGDECHTLLHWL
jgi:hypothetical protein